VRLVFRLLSWAYAAGVARRNRAFDTGQRQVVKATIPVISVGNLTTGGTGKTPLVIELIRRLVELGRSPAVVARGYRANRGGLADELTMISERLPKVPCIANPDRSAAVAEACRLGSDVALLDDGFQHRRLARDLDIVVIDATRPFGYGRVLPAGLLREPPQGLQRAGLVVITRTELVEAHDVQAIQRAVADYASACPIVQTRFRPAGIETITGQPPEPDAARAFVTAGVGHPASVLRTVCDAGYLRVGCLFWPDHHHYRQRDVGRIQREISTTGANLLLTTHKDIVKLRPMLDDVVVPVGVIQQTLEFLNDGDAVINHCLACALETDLASAPRDAGLASPDEAQVSGATEPVGNVE